MKNVLVTGGCGFIGSNFIRLFLGSHPDWSVVNLDKLTYAGSLANTDDFSTNKRYEFVHGDICDRRMVESLIKRVDAVIHFAAETHVDRSIDNADDFLMTNFIGTRVLLEAARLAGVRRFVHMSSDEVYGSIAEGAVSETAPLLPNSPYSASKAAGDLMVRAYWMTYQYPAMIVRCSNNYGPYQFPEKVIPLFITNLLEGKTVPLYGKGENRRDWIYVEDACKGVELVFDQGSEGEIYNLGAGNEKTNLELTHAILKTLNSDESKIRYVSDRPGHDFRYSVETSKVRKLGFKPSVSFEEGLERTVNWYRQNRSWWERLKRDKFTLK
ncbi:MAG: dTDP-glucose 4,6-dehydratase [Candidatus Omnitrophica bacterium]|nr:dTDP-glucose 4,6-dehydratase [Candidatus Omnitrophota bacterium]